VSFLLRRLLKPVAVVVVVLATEGPSSFASFSSSSDEDEDTERVVLGDSFRFIIDVVAFVVAVYY
jgi:hypothetical protein